MDKKKREPFLPERERRIIGGMILMWILPIFFYGFVGTELLPVSKEVFIGAWLGAILGFSTIEGFKLFISANKY